MYIYIYMYLGFRASRELRIIVSRDYIDYRDSLATTSKQHHVHVSLRLSVR